MHRSTFEASVRRPPRGQRERESRRATAGGPGGGAQPSKLLLTPDEAAATLGVGKTLLYELLSSREIASFKVGRVRRVPMSSLVEYVARRVSEAA